MAIHSHFIGIATAALIVLLSCGLCSAGVVYTGSLSSDNAGELDGNGEWISGTSTVSWTVEQVGNLWTYTYEIDVADRDISHFILELSLGAEADDFTGLSLVDAEDHDVDFEMEIQTFTPGGQGGSNPGLPDDIYGMKIEPDDDTTFVKFGFTTLRQPVWSDFYAKDGVSLTEGGTVHMFNGGFGDPDSDPDMETFPAADGSQDFHLLAPDAIPEPATMALLAVGGAFALIRRRLA